MAGKSEKKSVVGDREGTLSNRFRKEREEKEESDKKRHEKTHSEFEAWKKNKTKSKGKEEDEESVSKQLKKKGTATIKGPKVKERKKSAPATQVHKDKKKYDRKDKKETFDENSDIINFIECILSKKYASANKYLNNAVESKIQKQIETELETPLFQ